MRSYGFSSNALAGVCGATWLPRGRAVRQREAKYKDVQSRYLLYIYIYIHMYTYIYMLFVVVRLVIQCIGRISWLVQRPLSFVIRNFASKSGRSVEAFVCKAVCSHDPPSPTNWVFGLRISETSKQNVKPKQKQKKFWLCLDFNFFGTLFCSFLFPVLSRSRSFQLLQQLVDLLPFRSSSA